jgi:thioredoxin reductase (NADPH)
VRTLVVDAGAPSNGPAHAIGGLLGQDGVSPAALYEAGRAQLAPLPTVELRSGTVAAVRATGARAPAFRADLADGTEVTVARVLLATGMRYAVPDIPGIAELWGDSAFACPYCHGWELRDRRIAILGREAAAERVRLLRSWSRDLIVLASGELPDGERRDLEALDADVDERPVTSVSASAVTFAEGARVQVDALHVVAPMVPRDDLMAALGVATADSGPWASTDRFGATNVAGVFAAGDVANAGNVAAAIAGGSLAGTGLHRSLIF